MFCMVCRNGWLEKCLQLAEQLQARDLLMVRAVVTLGPHN